MKNFLLIVVTLYLFIGLPVCSIEYQQTSDFYFRKIFTPAENQLIKSFSNDFHSNDILFFNFQKLFETKIYEMNNKDVDEITEWYADDYDLRLVKIPKSYYVNHGILVSKAEGGQMFSLDNIYLKNKYGKYLSPEYNQWLDIKQKRNISNIFNMTAEEKYNEILYLENFINKYPTFAAQQDVKHLLNYMIDAYIGTGYENTINLFDDKNKLKKSYKKSYENFIKKNKKSKYYSVVKLYYEKLKQYNFEKTTEFQEWRINILGEIIKHS